jgi:hypothetical protein
MDAAPEEADGARAVSDELLAGHPALAPTCRLKVAMSIRWKTNEAILFGTGNGAAAGRVQVRRVVVQAKDSGQATLHAVGR